MRQTMNMKESNDYTLVKNNNLRVNITSEKVMGDTLPFVSDDHFGFFES
jgi:hypothetical protein